MTFIIDENITPGVIDLFKQEGLNAHHVNQLKSHSKQRIIDDQLRRLSMRKGYILVTKDDDFVHSFVDRKVPEKLVFLYGLDDKPILLRRISEIIPSLTHYLQEHDFIEINKSEVRFPFSF